MKKKLAKGLTYLLFGIPSLVVLASIMAPLTEASGWHYISDRLYFLLSYICPQIPSHSLWLLGAPTGVCSRSLFLYLSFVAAGLLMFQRHAFLSWEKSLLLLIPILVDGLTQIAGWRESTNLLRVLTGSLGGIGIAGLVMPVWVSVMLAVSGGNVNRSLSPMVVLNRFAAGLLIVSFLGANLFYSSAKAQTKLTIPEGTRVAIKTLETISSESAKRGQAVRFEVVRNVEVNGKVVIKSGALVTAEVTRVESRRAIGREGVLQVSVRNATAVDGTQVPLRITLEEKGEEALTTTVVLSVVICPLFLLMKGDDAVIPEGTEFTVFVDRPVGVTVD